MLLKVKNEKEGNKFLLKRIYKDDVNEYGTLQRKMDEYEDLD